MILNLTKPALLGLLIIWQVAPLPIGPASHFRYQRAVRLSSSPASAPPSGQACAVLDADVFAHAAPSLKDLRLYSGQSEIPYATTLSEPLQQESEDARILNLRAHSGHILFDLEMPRRPYTGLNLNLAAHDYLAKATVFGSPTANSKDVTQLGTFTLFDLTSQHLSHITDIPLSESTFPYLHLDLTLTPAPGGAAASPSLSLPEIVKSVTVPPSREAQSLYTTTQRVDAVPQDPESIATFKVRSRVPIERIAFTLPPGYKGSFSRVVRIEAHGINDETSSPDAVSSQSITPLGVETVTGTILRVHKTEAGRELSAEALSIPVAIGSNMQQPAVIEVRVENGSEPPLPLSVELQMRQRRICFDAAALNAPATTAPLTLYYGDASLDAPAYQDAALQQAAANPRIAQLGPESQNSAFSAPSAPRKFNQHRPILRWIALLGCVSIFALLVIRRTHRRRH